MCIVCDGSSQATSASEPKTQCAFALQFEPKVLGYLRFLQESKLVFDCLEEVVAKSGDPSCAIRFYACDVLQTRVRSERGVCLAQ